MIATKPCPGCDRERKVCWADPCAHLRILKAGPAWKLGAWVVEGGGALHISQNFHLESQHKDAETCACGKPVHRGSLCIRCEEKQFDAAERALPPEARLWNQ